MKQRKTNIICWECGIKGHYSNECPNKQNTAPKPIAHARKRVKTKDSVKPNFSKDPTNALSSSGGNPINTNIGRVRNHIIIEDSVKGLYSLTNHREVTLATSRHEEKKKINHHEPATEYPEVARSHKVSKNKLNQVWGSKPRRSLSHLSLGLVGLFISL
jgi:hypothetical protein